MKWSRVWVGYGALAIGIASAICLHETRGVREARVASTAPSAAPAEETGSSSNSGEDTSNRSFRIPSGEPARLSCDAARHIVGQARDQLAYASGPVDPKAFGSAVADWLDPYGLWSVAPDAAPAKSFERGAAALLADIEGRGSVDCAAAQALGSAVLPWVAELRRVFDDARVGAASDDDAWTGAAAPVFEGESVTRPAHELAATLGRRLSSVVAEFGDAAPYVDVAAARYFPSWTADDWASVVLASAVRAYVPLLDPHGAWAPLDEESSVYEVDIEAHPPERLWDTCERTAVGIVIESGATAPLEDGDVVLSLAGVATAGMSLEQIDQLEIAAAEERLSVDAVVLRGAKGLVEVSLHPAQGGASGASENADSPGELPVDAIAFGESDALVVTIADVRDDLGDALTHGLLRAREHSSRPVAGIVLDLRGNGGGSTDGAIDALGLFLPGAPLFPMRRRDGSIETDRAPEPPAVDRWRGPVATLVDANTASAAEMIAGALASYRRGHVVGERTFGKGCAQEHLDDDERAGVLRLTTLLYALPDGKPVQRVGLVPTLRLAFQEPGPHEREADLVHAAPTWRGPDVRDRRVLSRIDDGTWAWPAHGGHVGPCRDAQVCKALRLLGAPASRARRFAPAKGR
jgi:carboxyl-terminal processing protease